MFLLNARGYRFKAQKCKSPRFKRGAWDSIPKIIRGKEVQFFLDFTWGWYFYFKYEGQWYKVRHTNKYVEEQIDSERLEKFRIEAKIIMNRIGTVIITRGEKHKMYNPKQSSRNRLRKLIEKDKKENNENQIK
jgi:hypothetical protein